jgi:hypothetical protein
MRNLRQNNKGQMHTVEGLIAAIIMILVLVLVVKSTAITPLSSSSTNKHVQLELMNMGEDVLTSLDYDTTSLTGTSMSPLKESILIWNGNQFVLSNGATYTGTYVSDNTINNNPLAKALLFAFNGYGVAYDVEVVYIDANGNAISKKMIWNGDPSDNAVTVSKTIALHSSEIGIVNPDFIDQTGIPSAGSTTASDLYNLVDVKLTLWRM